MSWRPPIISVPPLYVLSPLMRTRGLVLMLPLSKLNVVVVPVILLMPTLDGVLPSTSLLLTMIISLALEINVNVGLKPFKVTVWPLGLAPTMIAWVLPVAGLFVPGPPSFHLWFAERVRSTSTVISTWAAL